MRVGLTGATGLAGYPIGQALVAAGHDVVTLGRQASALPVIHRPWSLGEIPDLSGLDVVVHAALSHAPGRYRGGEGDNPDGFLQLNREGSLRLVEAAGSRRVVFLSSRAVYGAYPPDIELFEEMEPWPDTLYGRIKYEVEQAVSEAGGVSLRATGLYGPPPPGRQHKWASLFLAFSAGRRISPRASTEVHADDLAHAVEIMIEDDLDHSVYNVSDIVLDRRDLLSIYSAISGADGILPRRADLSLVGEMRTTRLRDAGWHPRGQAVLEPTIRELVELGAE